MYIFMKKKRSGKHRRNKSVRLRAKLQRKNVRRKIRVSGQKW